MLTLYISFLGLLKQSIIDRVAYITEMYFTQSGSWEVQDDGHQSAITFSS